MDLARRFLTKGETSVTRGGSKQLGFIYPGVKRYKVYFRIWTARPKVDLLPAVFPFLGKGPGGTIHFTWAF